MVEFRRAGIKVVPRLFTQVLHNESGALLQLTINDLKPELEQAQPFPHARGSERSETPYNDAL
jgi:hypothetical protein